jgi:hypothetical protein
MVVAEVISVSERHCGWVEGRNNMRRGDRVGWVRTGFLLPVLILLGAALSAQPLLSLARSNGVELANSQKAEGIPPLGTHEDGSRSNWWAMVPGDPSAPGAVPDESSLAAASSSSPLVVPAADFSSDGGFPDGYFFDFEAGFLRGDGFACLKAPAYLPDGVTVDYVGASLYDNASGRVTVNLKRVDVVSGAVNTMATLGTPWDSTDIQSVGDNDIDYEEISYPAYAYFLTICLSSANHRLYSVRIYYTEP